MLKKFFKAKSNITIEKDFQLSVGLSQTMLQFLGSRGIPTMPGAAQKAFELSINPNAEARDFIDVIKSDEALSARILKISNSVFFERGKKCETIEDGVLLIGLTELRGLLNANTLKDLFPSTHPARSQFWANDIATGIIAKNLARQVLPEKSDLAFTAGLMHDIGKLLILQRAPDIYDKVLKSVKEKGISFQDAEIQLLAFSHCDLGFMLAEKWNFSSDLKNAIGLHHIAWTEQDLQGLKNPPLYLIIKSADIVAHSLGLGHTTGFGRLQNNCKDLVNTALSVIGIKAEDINHLLETLKQTFQNESELYL